MDDATYVFNQTSAERKRTGRGAISKKNGSKSKRCTLPSDRLSAAEKKKLSGECKKYDLSKPMNWKQFMGMPKDLQSEYLQKLVSYGAGKKDAADMFGCSVGALSQYLYCYHKGEGLFKKMLSSKERNSDDFMKWLGGGEAQNEEQTVEPAAEETKTIEEPVAVTKTAEKSAGLGLLQIESGSLTFTGDARTIFEKALLLMDDFSEYSVTISFQKMGQLGICA